jgi:hypothetical protein
VNPRGVCALCKHASVLQGSHLMPKALYKLLRSPELLNPHPTMMSRDAILETSRQAKTFLLCSVCEQRFHRNGEDWMLRNCCRASDEFRLRESLLSIAPGYFDGQVSVFSGKTANVDLAKLVYFAVSVFWRAAVSHWVVESTRLESLELGTSFTEQFRLFLVDEQEFPVDAATTTEVLAFHEASLNTAVFPYGGRKGEFHFYSFAIPGVRFDLYLGKRIPAEARRMCTFRSPEGLIMLTNRSLIQEVAGAIGRDRLPKLLKKIPKAGGSPQSSKN